MSESTGLTVIPGMLLITILFSSSGVSAGLSAVVYPEEAEDCGLRITTGLVSARLSGPAEPIATTHDQFQVQVAADPSTGIDAPERVKRVSLLAADVPRVHPGSFPSHRAPAPPPANRSFADPFSCPHRLLQVLDRHGILQTRWTAPLPTAPRDPSTGEALRVYGRPFQVVAIDPIPSFADKPCVACSRMILLSPAQELEAKQMAKDIQYMTQNNSRIALQAGLLSAMMLAGQVRPSDVSLLIGRRSTYLAENLALASALRRWRHPLPSHPGELIMDGHTHTEASHDSAASIQEKLIAADRAGYDVIAITDHNAIWAAQEAARMLPSLKQKGLVRPEFQVIVGEEIRAQGGYILAYFIESKIEPEMTLEETIRAVHRQGGLAFLAHPAHMQQGDTHVREDWIDASDLDGVEAGSGTLERPYDFYEISRMRDKFPGKAKIFGGDSHVTEQTGSLFGYTVLETSDHSLDGIRAALQERRTRVEYLGLSYYYSRFVEQPVIGTLFWTFSGYDWLKEQVEGLLAKILLADDVVIWTRWDTALYQAINLVGLPALYNNRPYGNEIVNWGSGGGRITAFYGPMSVTFMPQNSFWGLTYVKQF